MPIKNDSVEVKNLAFLKFGATPNVREGRQMIPLPTVSGAQPKHQWTLLEFHRVQVIDSFQIAGPFLFNHLINLLLHALDHTLHFDRLLYHCLRPINASHI